MPHRRHVARIVLLILALLLIGCSHEEPPPPVPPMTEDLSQWVVPELVQPAKLPQPPPAERPATKAEQVDTYAPGTTYKCTVPIDAPLDILLEPGEGVLTLIGSDPGQQDQTPPSDQANQAAPKTRWEFREGKSGQGETMQQHVFLRAAALNLTLGLTITTTKRVYYLMCKSVKTSPIRMVRWRYDTDTPTGLPPEPLHLLPDPQQPMRYHVGYTITASGRPPDWMVRQVVDDGKKLYILYPEVSLYQTVPVVRQIGPNGPQLLNARQHLNVVIVDQLPGRLELRVGLGEHAEVVTIARGSLKTIECPGDPDCPQWPAAAQTLARRPRP